MRESPFEAGRASLRNSYTFWGRCSEPSLAVEIARLSIHAFRATIVVCRVIEPLLEL